MKRAFKILIGLGFLLIAITVAGVAVLSSLDFNDYKVLIAEKAKEATGRDLVISGNLDLNISLNPSVSVNGVTFSNASWGSNPEMLSLDSFAAEVELIPLLSGDVQVKRIVLQGVNVLLETDNGGHGNWVFKSHADTGVEDSSSDSGDGSLPVVQSILVRDVNVSFRDGVSGQTQDLTLAKLDLSADGRNDPLSLIMEAVYNNESINVAGTLGSVAALSNNDMFPLKLDISALGAKIGLDGTIKEPRAGKGVNIGFDIRGEDVSAIARRGMAMAGVDGNAPLPAKPIIVTGALRDPDGGYVVDGLHLIIGGSDLSGSLSVNLAGARPELTADISSNHFDVSDVQTEQSESSEPAIEDSSADDGRVFPADPLPLDGLGAADAKISFVGETVQTSGITIGNVAADIELKNKRLTISSFGLDFGGGRIEGKVKLDGSGSAAKLVLAIEGSEIDYGKILKEMAGEESVTGMVDISLNADGVGKSVRSLMAGLNGKLRVVSEKGHIESGALTFLTGPLSGLMGDGDTNELRCAVLDFDIVKGMASSKAIVFETGGLSVIGEGSIDLREEKLDLRFDPRAKNASVASVAEVGILVGGTLKSPSIGPDMADAAMGAASLVAGIATGGISTLLSSVADSTTSGVDNTDYCALALAGQPLKPDETAKSENTAPAGSEQPAAQEQDPVEGLLNNLFGN